MQSTIPPPLPVGAISLEGTSGLNFRVAAYVVEDIVGGK
jgi:hypothetical protein